MENLHGPTNRLLEQDIPWKSINENTDLDSGDPRWFELFMEYFIHVDSKVADDLLFFVRKFVPTRRSSSGSINDQEAVLVRRRVAGQAPALNDVIDWKQSFFLNLLCQQSCTLTASICVRSSDPNDSRRNGGMVALKRVTKKVFAAPYKSRMDVKDAVMNECSYPLVYYTINDFESDTLHLPIFPEEYLCVELSVVAPKDPDLHRYSEATEKVASIPINENNDPFPTPRGFEKVVLFQGAVSFQALSTVYQQKGQGNIISEQSNRHRTEYIQMKGPHGNGQCQGFHVFKF